MVWLPLADVLLKPGPLTTADVAFAVVHATVVDPGAVAVVGLALIEPVTFGAAGITTTVAV